MLEDHAKLLAVLKAVGEGTSRKKLQKIVYILKKLNYPFHEKYRFQRFGPYSDELTLQVDELCNLGFVHEINGRYITTDEGERFLSHFHLDMPGFHECMANLNRQSDRFLELVASVIHFNHLSKEEAIKKAKSLWPSERKAEIEKTLPYFEGLKGRGKDLVLLTDF